MQLSRFKRFDRITVRAAARVLRLGRLGRLSPGEMECLIAHLAEGSRAAGPLARLARRRAVHSEAGVPQVFQMRRQPEPGHGRPGHRGGSPAFQGQ